MRVTQAPGRQQCQQEQQQQRQQQGPDWQQQGSCSAKRGVDAAGLEAEASRKVGGLRMHGSLCCLCDLTDRIMPVCQVACSKQATWFIWCDI